ncbi:nascent polypeptide-associated complex subunit alpha, muscle-specific form-like isoform X3 [Spodoptera frugiperda]|uniref:Nascent polypeptide-associated complex subunit alpha, muscle-specific form-like isoform X2 n=1 Tax=Spodoptera frugiperda TaxID=7108 RepID=A0A9R0DZJ5_SPOFR|nr:nascent polypeptide-associated complex subunit alpha, muscle-specific form-like isoform X2 [Spodoptera frugiperda]XP_050556408.1 nascent polypeptide-associated complex subunit alpha, muscle-specific form-like isoform X3 [Spodoptera frugiperda]
MISRRRAVVLLLACLAAARADQEPATDGLVHTDTETDLVAEATQTGPAQKREAVLSNSYGEPLPADAYGPPLHVPDSVPDLPQGSPAPVYGVPDALVFPPSGPAPPPQPAGTYGPPAPVSFPSQVYHGPPPPVQKLKPVYGPPKPVYGPPKPVYGPPKPVYGPPKPVYGPPKFSPPKKTYGPPKLSLPKPTYGAPFKPPKITLNKPLFSAPKPVYGPPKPVYGPPKPVYGPPPPRDIPALPLPELPQVSLPPINNNNLDLGLNLPAPIYGTPLLSLPVDLKPNFPLPTDTYGPPGHPLGPNDQLLLQNVGSVGHYGPPQPDPNPRPPHPGVPAPPTPPHVLYDGWKPIPGVSLPHGPGHIAPQYGPPQDLHIELEQNLPSLDLHQQFSPQQQQHGGADITSGYSSVHQDALANIDLRAILGGDSNHIAPADTVFEAHYTEGDSARQHGGKGLVAPSGQYGVPPGAQYGAPPGLPLAYGQVSGGGHAGGAPPRAPLPLRAAVPRAVFQHIAHTTTHNDVHHSHHAVPGPQYLPPPIPHSGGHSVALSIEPTSLVSVPHSPPLQEPSGSYGSPVDSYSAPLLTVAGDHVTSGSSTDSVTSTIDGTVLANLSSLSALDAAAILKHCPYHEAILRAARAGDGIPRDLAAQYASSLSSLGAALTDHGKREDRDSHTVHKDTHKDAHVVHKSKSIKEKHTRAQQLQQVSQQIQDTQARIRSLNLQAQQLQHKIAATGQAVGADTPRGAGTAYSVQIQPSQGGPGGPAAPHDQLLSDGLLQSILQAIDDPGKAPQLAQQQQHTAQQHTQQQQPPTPPQLSPQQSLPALHSAHSFTSNARESFSDGIVLPPGYEPVDRSHDQHTQATEQHSASDCGLAAAASTRTESVVPAPTELSRADSDTASSEDSEVALFFGDKAPVTELSVATSISGDSH